MTMKAIRKLILFVPAILVMFLAGAATRNEFDCVYLNEVCWSNTKVEDGAGNFKSDWVELYNPRSFTVDVCGYAIGLKSTWIDSQSDGKLFVLPSYKMKPGSFLLIFFNKDYTAADTGLDASKAIIRSNAFNLGKNGDKTQQDSVRLFAPTEHTRVSNFKDIPVQADNTSYGWVHDGSFDLYGRQNISLKVFANPTPGASNYGGDDPVAPDPTLKINEVCYSNSTIDDGMGDKNCDFVELYNPGPDAVNLGGMKLGKKATVADCGEAVFQLPDYLLEPNEFFVVFFDKGAAPKTETVTRSVNGVEKSVPLIRSDALSFGTGYSVEVPGSEGTNVVVQDSVRLFAANGWRIDSFKGEDVAAALGVVKNPSTGEWEGLVEKEASVGYLLDADADSGLAEFRLPTPWGQNGNGIADRLPPLKINEVCYSNSRMDDGMGELECDFVEIYNPGPDAVGIGGMKLGKKSSLEDCGTSVFEFPNYTLSPNEFFVVFFNKDVPPQSSTVKRTVNGVEKSVPLIRSNALSLGKGESTEVPGSEGTNVVVQDSVRLFAADGRRIDSFKGDDVAAAVGVVKNPETGRWEGIVETDASVGPKTDGGTDLTVLYQPTPWGSNATGTRRPTLIVINEVCYSNSTIDDGMGNRDCDFVELYNPGPDAVGLGGMKLGKKGTLEKCGTSVFEFPDYTLSPNEFFVVFFNKDVPPQTSTVKRTVNGVEKSVPLIRSDALSFGTGTSTEVPGYEDVSVTVQDSVRLFSANGTRIANFKGEDVAAALGVVKNPETGKREGLVEKEASVGYLLDADEDSGLALFRLPTPWGVNGNGIADPLPPLKINEVCYSNSRMDDGMGELESDFVEIYNPGPDAVGIGGMKLGKKSSLEDCGTSVFEFPDYTLSPNEFFVVFFNKDVPPQSSTVKRTVNGVEKTVPLIRSNALSLGKGESTEVPGSEGTNVVVQDSVRLFAADGRRIDVFNGVDVAAAVGVVKNQETGRWEGIVETDASVGPKTDGGDDLTVFYQPTPWGSNATGTRRPTFIVINEVCYSNSTIDDGMGNRDCDFVELYNPGPDAVSLGGMKLGKKGTLEKCGTSVFTLPDYLLEPNEFFVVFFNKDVPPQTSTVKRTVNGVEKDVPLIRSDALSFGTGTSVEVPGSEGTNVVVQDSVRLFSANGTRIANFKGEDVAAALGVVKNPETGEWEGLVEEEASVGYLLDADEDSGLALFRLPTPWGVNGNGIADPLPPLKINEVCYSNSRMDDGMGELESDFVEIYNPGPDAVGIGGMKLGKKGSLEDCGTSVFEFPDYTLSPNEFFVVFFNKDVPPQTSTVKRTVNGVEKSVPLIRSNALSLGKGESTEVPGSEGTNVVVQDSVRLFAADGRRIDSFKGDDVAVAVGVVKNPETGRWEGIVETDASVGPKTDGGDDLTVLYQPTPWGSNATGTRRPTFIVINEVCYSNSTIDDGMGNRDCDFVELYNPGPDAVSLGGMKLGKKGTLEKCGTSVFTLPDYLLEPNEFFVVFFNKDVPSVTNVVTRTVNGVEKSVPLIRSDALSFGKGESTEVPGSEGTNVVVQDSIRLFAANGTRIANFKGEDVAAALGVVKNASTGEWEGLVEKEASVGPLADGGDDLTEFYQPTPWLPNASGIERPTLVVINEVCYDNKTVDDGTGNTESDWVELYNTGPGSVQLSGMKLGKKSTLEKCEDAVFTFPEYVMESNEFLVVFFDKNLSPATTVVVREVNGVEKSVKIFRSNAFSLGTDVSTEVPGYEGREVLVQDSVRLFAADGTRVSNYKGADIAEEIGVKIIGTTPSAVLEEGQTFGCLWDGNRLPSGETPSDAEKCRVVLSHETAWGPNGPGYTFAAPGVTGSVPGRYADAQDIVFTTDTGMSVRYTTDGSDPRVSPTAVTCAVGETVTIGAVESAVVSSGRSLTNAWIRTSPVELAAKEPDAAWRAPIGSVGRASAVRAVAVKGPACSAEWRGTWYVGPDFSAQTMPLVSVIADEDDLFSDEKGIYVPGAAYKSNGYGGNRWGKPYANYYGDGEIAAHVELVEPGADAETLAIDAGLAINGGGTRSLPQKALYVKMKSAYGAKNFTYDLFPSVGERTYRRFLLRPDGNDWYGPYTAGVSTMMKDAVFHRVVSGLDMYTMTYRPAVVYVNGSYWGIHNLRESVDKQAFATRYGLNEDLIDVLTHEDAGSSNVSVGLIDGTETAVSEYRNWLSSIQSHDISTAANYNQYVAAKMDVANYIDYIVTECFYANTDWPINNCDFWRSSADQTAVAGKYGDGRWRWALYDLDLAGLVVDGVGGVNRNMLTYLSGSKMTGVNEPGFLINRLWGNATFKNEFIRRYTELLNTTFRPERISAIVASAADEIDDEIVTHYRRWGRDFTAADWRAAVKSALVDYTAQRWTNGFVHASTKFGLGGVGEIRVMNDDPSGTGGHFVVDGTVIDSGTDGVSDRADWTGRYYPGRPVTIVAVPDTDYVFDSWVGSSETSPSRQVTVTANGMVQFKARFRHVSALAPLSAGFSAWQAVNCDEQAVLRDEAGVQPGAVAVSKGGRDYTNFELFAFGVTKAEADSLSAAELKARTSLRIRSGDGMALEYGCSPYGGVDTKVKVAESLESGSWRTAETGTDVGPAETNRSSRDGWTVTVPLFTDRGEDFYRLEIQGDGR